MTTFLRLLAAPLLGAAFVLFLPLLGFIMLAVALGTTIRRLLLTR